MDGPHQVPPLNKHIPGRLIREGRRKRPLLYPFFARKEKSVKAVTRNTVCHGKKTFKQRAFSLLPTLSLISAESSLAQSAMEACEMVPTSPLEIRRAFSNPNTDKTPEIICLPNLPNYIGEILKITKMLGRFSRDEATQDKIGQYQRNGEMGGWIEFRPEKMLPPMLKAISVAGSPDLKKKGVAVAEFVNERKSALDALISRQSKSQNDKNRERDLEGEIKAATDFLFTAVNKRPDKEISSVVAAIPWKDLNLQTDFLPYGRWYPGTLHTGTASIEPPHVPMAAIAEFHSHPPGNSHFHSFTDIGNRRTDHEFPFYVGSFVYLEDAGKMTRVSALE